MDLTDLYKTFYPKIAKYTLFLSLHGIFSKIHHMVGDKTRLNKFKKIEIISSILLDYICLKLQTNLKEKTQKHLNTWRLNNMLLNNEWVNNEIKEEIKKYLKTNENEHTTIQNLWDIVKAVQGEKFIAIQAYIKKEDTKISNKQSNLIPKRTSKTTTYKAQSE